MSQLGKIFLIVALVGAVAALIAGYFVINGYDTTTTNLQQAQASIGTEKQKTKKAVDEATTAKAAETDAETKLTEAQTKLDGLNTQLADAEKKATDLQTAVQTSKDASDKAQAELTRISSVLQGKTPEDTMSSIDKLTAQVAADNAEQKILQDQLQAANKSVADLKVEINKSKNGGEMPPGISGKVTFVNSTWNFVVLNVGLSNGVVPNGELIVYRGRDFLGKVKVTSAEDNTAVADILPGAKADIQVGDDVLN